MRLVIIGGSDAGISAGLRARELDASADVQVVVADEFPNYSICGLPFYLSGETPDWHDLAHRTASDLSSAGLELLLNHRAVALDTAERKVRVAGPSSADVELAYDRLVIATGAEPVKPPIIGLDLAGVHLLHTMADSFQVQQRLGELVSGRVVIVGGGYIGVEMADAFRHRGLEVTLVEHHRAVLRTVDHVFGDQVGLELQKHGVEVVTATAIEAITKDRAGLLVESSHGFRRQADLVLVAVGVRPATELAAAAGVELGHRGAIRVNQRMETNLSAVYAAGDCVETFHRLLRRPVYLPLGTTAHKQGRVAGENAAGGQAEFQGSLGTQVVKVFDLAVARTGVRDAEAGEAGFDPLTTTTTAWDHKAYYPGAHQLGLSVTGDRGTGRLLGAQLLGDAQGQVAKRIDVFATALFHDMMVDALSDLDLSYTPPFSAPWDPVQAAAQDWGRMASLTS